MQSSSSERSGGRYAALRNRTFVLYASAWTLAVIGQQSLRLAIGWDLYDRTNDSMVLAMIGLLQAIPVIALAIPAGQLADRFSRKHILMISQLGAAATATGLLICHYTEASLGTYYVLLFCDGTMNALGWPARSAILPQLVTMEELPAAITWNSSFFQVASVTGPAIAGYIIARSVGVAYSIHIMTALWYVACVAMVKMRPQQISKSPVSLQSLVAGVGFVWSQKIILATITLDLFAVLLGGAVYLLPAVSKDILHVGKSGSGWLGSAPAAGALCMGLLLAHLPPMKQAGKTLLWAVAGFGVATILFGMAGLPFMQNHLGAAGCFALAIAALFFTGVFDNISVVVRHTLVQVLTPDEMRGRVSAVNGVFIGASNELGGFESGVTAKLFGVCASIIGGGIGTLVVVFGIDRLFPQVRGIGALRDAQIQTQPEDVETTSETANVGK